MQQSSELAVLGLVISKARVPGTERAEAVPELGKITGVVPLDSPVRHAGAEEEIPSSVGKEHS